MALSEIQASDLEKHLARELPGLPINEQNMALSMIIVTNWFASRGLKTPRFKFINEGFQSLRLIFMPDLPMIAETFEELTGEKSQQDDLDRVNCPDAKGVGHLGCGWCLDHEGPRFHCLC